MWHIVSTQYIIVIIAYYSYYYYQLLWGSLCFTWVSFSLSVCLFLALSSFSCIHTHTDTGGWTQLQGAGAISDVWGCWLCQGNLQKSRTRRQMCSPHDTSGEHLSGTSWDPSSQFPLFTPSQKHGAGLLVDIMDFKESCALDVSSEASEKSTCFKTEKNKQEKIAQQEKEKT